MGAPYMGEEVIPNLLPAPAGDRDGGLATRAGPRSAEFGSVLPAPEVSRASERGPRVLSQRHPAAATMPRPRTIAHQTIWSSSPRRSTNHAVAGSAMIHHAMK